MEKRASLCVTCVTILDTLQGIFKHLMTKEWKKQFVTNKEGMTSLINKEGMYLYVSYVITLDRQKGCIEWIEETFTRIRIIEGTTKEMMIV